ncbi:hypothetical protein DFH08DRAFT_676496, partial [Mycena albidolilacea]
EGDDAISASEARSMAEYTRWEGEFAALKPKEKSPEDMTEKLRSTCVLGIKKQISWNPSCKTGDSKWSYDGVCSDPIAFGSLLDLDAPPK